MEYRDFGRVEPPHKHLTNFRSTLNGLQIHTPSDNFPHNDCERDSGNRLGPLNRNAVLLNGERNRILTGQCQ